MRVSRSGQVRPEQGVDHEPLETEDAPSDSQDATQLQAPQQLTSASQERFDKSKLSAVKRHLQRQLTHLQEDHDDAVLTALNHCHYTTLLYNHITSDQSALQGDGRSFRES